MTTKAHTRRIFVALFAFVMAIGLSITGTVAYADDSSIPAIDTDSAANSDAQVNNESESTDASDLVLNPEMDTDDTLAPTISADKVASTDVVAGKKSGSFLDSVKTCDSETVVVKETIALSENITLKEGCTIVRDNNLMGPIFAIEGTTVTISGNATIDGNSVPADAPLIVVENGALTLDAVTITRGLNNKTAVVDSTMTDTSWNSKGGAIGARKSTVNLNGVTISGNTATLGGGLFADGSTVNVNSNTKFTDNEALYANANSFVAKHYAAGGGIFVVSVHENSTVTVAGKNISFENNGNLNQSTGGAIATGRLVKGKKAAQNDANSSFGFGTHGYRTTLKIEGGDFTSNKTELAGGALYIQRNDVAWVTGGNFTSNYAKGENENENNIQQFAGGAIYVEGSGTNHAWENGGIGQNLPAGKLHLENALITQNTAAVHGGGIAFCQTGDGFVGYAGAAIYNNHAGNVEDDVFIRRISSSPSSITLSRKAIGDIDNNWTSPTGDDPYFASNARNRHFVNDLEEGTIDPSKVAVTFKNNSTGQWGGAIAANGEVIMGEQVGAFYLKKIDGITGEALGNAKFKLTGVSESVKDYEYEVTTQVGGDNAGEAAFRDLLAGTYKLVETQAPEGYPDLQLNWTVVVADGASKYAVTIYDADGNKVAAAETRNDSAGNAYGVYELENNATVTRPGELELHTTATDNADGDKILAVGTVEVKDVVTYKNLTAGMPYTVKGKLVVKGTGGKNVVSEAEVYFVPESEDGSVEVIFSVDTTQLSGKELVAYEYLFEGDVRGEPIDLDKAEGDTRFLVKHADDNDAAQTVSVEKPGAPKLPVTGLPRTGSSISELTYIAALLIAGGALFLRRHRR